MLNKLERDICLMQNAFSVLFNIWVVAIYFGINYAI